MFNVKRISKGDLELEFSEITDVYINMNNEELVVQLIGDKKVQISTNGIKKYLINDSYEPGGRLMNPGDHLKCKF